MLSIAEIVFMAHEWYMEGWTQASTVTSYTLTAWAMVWPPSIEHY